MGKNRVRESLIREIANAVIHHIVAKHTNRPEAVHFLESETIAYRDRAIKTAESFNWNAEDLEYIKNKALIMINERLASKYSDVLYSEDEAIDKLNEMMKNFE